MLMECGMLAQRLQRWPIINMMLGKHLLFAGAETLVQWLKLPSWKVGNRGFEPHCGLQVSKKKMFLPCSSVKYLILWRASVIHLTILRRFSWPSFAYVHKCV